MKKKMLKCCNCFFVYNAHQRNDNKFTRREVSEPQMDIIERRKAGCCPACGSPYCTNVEIEYSVGDMLGDLSKQY